MTQPPTRKVAATSASAVRDWVRFPRPDFLEFSITNRPQSVLPHMRQVEPPSQCVRWPFGCAMRHELGSNCRMSLAEISCYCVRMINRYSAILVFNEFLTNIILGITDYQSRCKVSVSIAQMEQSTRMVPCRRLIFSMQNAMERMRWNG